MPRITYDYLMEQKASNAAHAYTQRDSMLYALAVGMGRDPLDPRELDYVYERRGTLRSVPSQAVTVARHNLIYDIGLVVEKMLHGEQKLTLHHPLPVASAVLADHRVLEVYDKGPAKGLLIETETRVRSVDGTAMFDVHNLYFARGDGGIGSPATQTKLVRTMPVRRPDLVRRTQTLPWHALLYRLTGDPNVIHGDPDIARKMGFKAPILHGAGTLGIACREVLAGVCGYDNMRIKTLGTRFTSIVYPGDLVETDIWVDGNVVRFRSRVPDRNVVVLDQGECAIEPIV